MRVIHLLDHSLPLQSGYVFRTMSIVREQKRLGIDPILVTSPRHYASDQYKDRVAQRYLEREEIDNWAIYRAPPPAHSAKKIALVREFLEMRQTRRMLRQLIPDLSPDILHVHSPVLNFWPAKAVSGRIPLVYEIRAFWEDAAVNHGRLSEGSPRYLATRKLETLAMRRADAVVTICNGLRRDIIERGIPSDKVNVIPNAVATEAFAPITGKDQILEAKLGLKGQFVLGFFGSFYDYEGLDLAIRALRLVHTRHPEVKLLLVGGGPKVAELRELAQSLSLNSHVIFTGRVAQDEIRRYYSLADLMVYPRKSMRLTETVTPLKPLEAMAMRVPVLASDVGGHNELIEDGKTGYLFQADNEHDFAQKICEIADLGSDLQNVLKQARHYVENIRNWRSSVAGYIPIYEKLTDPGQT